MKIQELKEAIKAHKREELEFIISELYKAIPKAKKEDAQFDELIKKPKKETVAKSDKKAGRTIKAIKANVSNFIFNAKEQNYLVPNRVIPKAQRSKWRFLVKNLYNEILAAEKNGEPTIECASVMKDLYECLTYSCHYICFTAYDTFESVGIDQDDFFEQIIKYYRDAVDISDFINISIRLIIDNPLNRYTLYSSLMKVFFNYCQTPAMREMVISNAKEILVTVKNEPEKKDAQFFSSTRNNELSYEKREKINNVVEIIFRAHCYLYEFSKGIDYTRSNYIEKNKEILLYVIVHLLFGFHNHEYIQKEIESNLSINPRESLLKLREYILKNGKLPDYI